MQYNLYLLKHCYIGRRIGFGGGLKHHGKSQKLVFSDLTLMRLIGSFIPKWSSNIGQCACCSVSVVQYAMKAK